MGASSPRCPPGGEPRFPFSAPCHGLDLGIKKPASGLSSRDFSDAATIVRRQTHIPPNFRDFPAPPPGTLHSPRADPHPPGVALGSRRGTGPRGCVGDALRCFPRDFFFFFTAFLLFQKSTCNELSNFFSFFLPSFQKPHAQGKIHVQSQGKNF